MDLNRVLALSLLVESSRNKETWISQGLVSILNYLQDTSVFIFTSCEYIISLMTYPLVNRTALLQIC